MHARQLHLKPRIALASMRRMKNNYTRQWITSLVLKKQTKTKCSARQKCRTSLALKKLIPKVLIIDIDTNTTASNWTPYNNCTTIDHSYHRSARKTSSACPQPFSSSSWILVSRPMMVWCVLLGPVRPLTLWNHDPAPIVPLMTETKTWIVSKWNKIPLLTYTKT